MNSFVYPLDTKTLLRKKLRIKKELLSQNISFIEKRVAVLGGSTTNEIVDQLELFLLNYGIKPTFYQSEYAQYWQDAVFGNEELDSFQPDIVFIHTNWRNITAFPTTASTAEEVNQLLGDQFAPIMKDDVKDPERVKEIFELLSQRAKYYYENVSFERMILQVKLMHKFLLNEGECLATVEYWEKYLKEAGFLNVRSEVTEPSFLRNHIIVAYK